MIEREQGDVAVDRCDVVRVGAEVRLLLEIQPLVRRAAPDDGLRAVGERVGTGEDLDHGPAALHPHRPRALARLVAVVLAVAGALLMSLLMPFAGAVFRGLMVRVLRVLVAPAVRGPIAFGLSDHDMAHHAQHLVGSLAHRAVDLVVACLEVEHQRRGAAGVELGHSLLHAAPLDFQGVRDAARVGHAKRDRTGRNRGRRELHLPLREVHLYGVRPRSAVGAGRAGPDQREREYEGAQ